MKNTNQVIENLSRVYQSTIDRNIHKLRKSKRKYTLCKQSEIQKRISRFNFEALCVQIDAIIDCELKKHKLSKAKRAKKKAYVLTKINNKLGGITRMYANMIFKNRDNLNEITEARIQVAVRSALDGFFGCP